LCFLQAAEADVAADHSARYSSQYERILVEYSEYLEAAKNKLPAEPVIATSGVESLRHQLSSHNVNTLHHFLTDHYTTFHYKDITN